ncbi:MAG: bifunctional phosphopantothenoylcysteine decarboxylase/phosphopantothenate--cysteine ligase CoaBC [Acidobacteriota bacterium]
MSDDIMDAGRLIGLGVTGSISAYKSAELLRALQKRGYEVQPIMTREAALFIGPLTLQALSRRKVMLDPFDLHEESSISHIHVADSMAMLLVAPATANIIAKFAAGIADDFLTCVYLAARCPVLIAPAMNSNMYLHAATQANIEKLRSRGVEFIDPEEGYLACGWEGAGRLADPQAIAARCDELLGRSGAAPAPETRRSLDSQCVLVTAGPTREPIDPVRYVSNRSSGLMGYAIAAEALRRGARVILISGPVEIEPPCGAELVSVETAEQMHRAVVDRLAEATIIIKAAAVADFRPAAASDAKIKKSAARHGLDIHLEPTADILEEVGRKKGDRLLVGFSAETSPDLSEARRKLEQKRCDIMVLNDVTRPGAGFGSHQNEVWILERDGQTSHLPLQAKADVAARLLDICEKQIGRR